MDGHDIDFIIIAVYYLIASAKKKGPLQCTNNHPRYYSNINSELF